MVTAIKMPDLGTNVEHVTLVAWLKQEGDSVRRGDYLCEVETDKATDQLECVAEGILLRRLVPAGSEIPAGSVIAYVGAPGETIPGESTPATTEKPVEGGVSAPAAAKSEVKIPPVLRNLAKREGVDIDSVVGTGPGGKITREDILAAKNAAAVPSAARQTATAEIVRLSKEQLAVARRVSRSNQEIPTVNLTASLDMSSAITLRERQLKEGAKVSFDSIFLFAIARTIGRFPSFACHVDDDRVVSHGSVDVCVAISHERKLYTPVVRGADKLSVPQIDAQVREFAKKARNGQLTSADLAGGSFTVSNLGMFPVQSFNVIIPPEQAGAMAVGQIEQRLIFRQGRVETAPSATVVLSIDHRLINGAEGAEFMRQLKTVLENL